MGRGGFEIAQGAADRGEHEHGASTGGILLVILAQAAVAAPAAEGLFDDPAAGQYRKAHPDLWVCR